MSWTFIRIVIGVALWAWLFITGWVSYEIDPWSLFTVQTMAFWWMLMLPFFVGMAITCPVEDPRTP